MVKNENPAEMCDMRGMLSFMILWLLSTRPMYGQELATEIGKRRGDKPNPGTIYPALKDLSKSRTDQGTSGRSQDGVRTDGDRKDKSFKSDGVF